MLANRSIELSQKDLNDWREDEILDVVKSQFSFARNALLPKYQTWMDHITLYLNAYRKKVSDITLGSKLLFTQFNDVFASVDNDSLRVEFKGRTITDEEKIAFTNAVARFDFREMDMDMKQREVLWNTLFFGYGVLDVSTYDRKNKILEPQVQSPFIFFVDPLSTRPDNLRFCGRYIYKTYGELLNHRDLDPQKVKEIALSSVPSGQSFEKQREEEAKRILLGLNYVQDPFTPTAYIEILEWYFYNNDKLWVVWTDNGITKVLGFKEVKYNDKKGGGSKVPFVFYYFQKIPWSIWGISLPDLLDDYHRADVLLKNLMFQGISFDALPKFLANLQAFYNPKDLTTIEERKVVPTKIPPTGQIVPFPKSQVVSNDTLAFMNILQNEAIGAAGTSRILRGSLTQVKKTATEIAIAKAKQDLQMSSIVRNIIEGEKTFWYIWLKRHKQFLSEDDEKLIEIIGYQGAKEFISLKKKDFIPETDPHIEVVSSLVSEPTKIIRRREMLEVLPIVGQMGGNSKEVLKKVLFDMDLTPEEVDMILPPSPHELLAREENEKLSENEFVPVNENDDDLAHIAVHQRAENTDAKEIHIRAHYKAYMLKSRVGKITKKLEDVEIPENLGEAEKETRKTLTEGLEAIGSSLRNPLFPKNV